MGKNPHEKATVEAPHKPRGLTYERPLCGHCGAGTRQKFVMGSGKGARAQHSTRRVCENGHYAAYKRGQRG